MKRCLQFIAFAFVAVMSVSAARAATIPYPNGGIENPVEYTFTASTTGTLTAHYYGSNASFVSELGLLINGVESGTVGLNTSTSPVGSTISWNVVAGQVLTFYINVITSSNTFYSTKSMNADGTQHIYATAFSGDSTIGVPGTYVAFEDLFYDPPNSDSDFNYQDHQFVFTNVAIQQTPVPAALPLFATGLGVLAFLARRRRQKAVSFAA